MKLSKSLFCLVLSFLIACAGGGSSGTGIKRIEGVLFITDTGEVGTSIISRELIARDALAGATVTVAETGDSTVSAEDGSFLIETRLGASEITLLIDINEISTSAELGSVPSGNVDVSVDIEVDSSNNKATPTRVEVTEQPKSSSNSSSNNDEFKPSPTPTPFRPIGAPSFESFPPNDTELPVEQEEEKEGESANPTPTSTPTNENGTDPDESEQEQEGGGPKESETPTPTASPTATPDLNPTLTPSASPTPTAAEEEKEGE